MIIVALAPHKCDSNTSAQIQKIHTHHKQLLDSDKELMCVSYHYDAGHGYGLEITLNTKSQHIKFMRRIC
ncbi:hypothetical protein [Campylobacter concisus]